MNPLTVANSADTPKAAEPSINWHAPMSRAQADTLTPGQAVAGVLSYDSQLQDVLEQIRQKKRELKGQMIMPTHYYQRPEVVDLGDYRGDSLKLAQWVAEQNEPIVVYCGVRFMAESADILRRPNQKIYLPNLKAGCPMADMSDLTHTESAYAEMSAVCEGEKIVPVTYMNSWADLKAFTGAQGGAVCTSSNAHKIFEWAFTQGQKILFFPDEHLGRNVSNKMGIPREQVIVWNRFKKPFGGNTEEQVRNAKIILWKGYCHVHTHFTVEHVKQARAMAPDAMVVVHPECSEEVVAVADKVGSTTFICKFIEEAPAGSTIFVGTEINLIARLARDNPDKKIFELSRSLCHNMFRVSAESVLWTLNHLDSPDNIVEVPENIKADARLALERMLSISTN